MGRVRKAEKKRETEREAKTLNIKTRRVGSDFDVLEIDGSRERVEH